MMCQILLKSILNNQSYILSISSGDIPVDSTISFTDNN